MTQDGEVNLKMYMETIVAALRHDVDGYTKHHAAMHVLIQTALDKAEAAMNQRLETMNEFRAQLNEQRGTFATKEMMEPMQRFQDKLLGFGIGITVLNAVITYLIVRLLSQ